VRANAPVSFDRRESPAEKARTGDIVRQRDFTMASVESCKAGVFVAMLGGNRREPELSKSVSRRRQDRKKLRQLLNHRLRQSLIKRLKV